MVRIDVCAYTIGRADIARVAGMNIRHLHDMDTFKGRMVALRFDPVDGRCLDIISEYFGRCMFTFNCHIQYF